MRHAVVVATLALAFAGSVVLGISLFGDDEPTEAAATATDITLGVERDPDVPALPFADNPDPSQCGIPVRWGESGEAWLTGLWDGELIQPEVLLYDSHLRAGVTAGAPHGTEVEIVLFQENPVLDYYFVRIPGDPGGEGWVPAPFLSFDPVGDDSP